MCICEPLACLALTEARRGSNWSYITDGFESHPHGCGKLNPGLLEEQSTLLTTKPSLSSPLKQYF